MHRRILPFAVLALLAACGDPPDDSPIGRECRALLERPAQPVDAVKVRHVLISFVGARQGSESKRTYAEARTLATELLARARAGEDFAQLVRTYSNEEGKGEDKGTYRLTKDDSRSWVAHFFAAAFRLAPGEIGPVVFHPSRSPWGFHIIKRLE